MKLVQSMPHTVLRMDPRSLKILLGMFLLVLALVSVLHLARNTRPAVESILTAMNANILSLVGTAH